MSSICDELRVAILQALIPDPDKCPDEKRDYLVKLSDLPLTYMRGNGLRKNDVVEKGARKCILYGELFTRYTDGVINETDLSETNTISSVLSKSGDILIPGTSTASKEVMLRARELYVDDVQIGGDINIIRPNAELFYPKYMSYVFDTFSSKRQLFEYITGTTGIIHISNSGIKNLIFYLPPIDEQKRIVKKVDELMARVADLEQSADALASLKKAFPDDIKASLLQAAMQGKLTEQLSEDGDAEELLDQIKVEKEKLIAEGKIKRQKPLAPITDDEIPFSVPKNWRWVRIDDYVEKVTDFVASGSFASLRENVKYYRTPNYALLVRTLDLSNNFQKELVYTDRHGYEFLSNSNLSGGELVLPNIGASIGKVFVVPSRTERMTLAPNSVMVRFLSDDHRDWFYCLFSSPFGLRLLQGISSSTAQGKFNKTDFRKLIIPIPPLLEQKRIVRRVDGLIRNINAVEELMASYPA